MRSIEVSKRKVSTKEKIKLLIYSSVLASLIINAFVTTENSPVEQPQSPIATPSNSGPRLSN